MHLQALRYLVAVAEEGHFGRAAERMHVSQPSISQAVARLEQQFGARLLDRSGGRVVPTPAGARVLDDVRASLRHLDAALAAAGAPEATTLRIGCTPFFSMWVTVELLTPFRDAHPHVEVSVAELSVPEQVRALLAGEVQLAVGEPLGADARLRERTIREDPCVVWMSADHPLRRHEEIPLRGLAGVPLADGDADLHPAYRAWVRGVFAAAGVTPTFAPPARDSPSAMSRIIDGSMVSIAADIMPEGTVPGIVVRRVSDPVRWSWVTTSPRNAPTEAAVAFEEWAQARR